MAEERRSAPPARGDAFGGAAGCPADFHAQTLRASGAEVAGIPKIMHKTRGKIGADVCGNVTFKELHVGIL